MATMKTTEQLIEYMRPSFTNAPALVAAMDQNMAFLSGSRALEFIFEEAKAVEDSDWDFYLPFIPALIVRFIKSLQAAKVEIHSKLMEVVKHSKCRSKWLSSQSTLNVLQRIINVSKWESENRESRYARRFAHAFIAANIQRLPVLLRVNRSNKKVCLKVEQDDRNNAREQATEKKYLSFFVINGHTTHNGTSQRVQLVIPMEEVQTANLQAAVNQVLSAVIRFHSSQVQCLVSGQILSHLYPHPTMRREGYAWDFVARDENEAASTDDKIRRDELAREKYTKRNWKIIKRPQSSPTVRKLGDGKSLLVDMASTSESQKLYKAFRRVEWLDYDKYLTPRPASIHVEEKLDLGNMKEKFVRVKLAYYGINCSPKLSEGMKGLKFLALMEKVRRIYSSA